ncbi:hypothetical protein Q1695_009085 [Nippostrongylus brasiliensis]|nr:hypothetical protein Q1695_009085 [Nippostrongylus brasiliensis]
MSSDSSGKPNFFQRLKSWRSSRESPPPSCTDVVPYTGPGDLQPLPSYLCLDYYHILGVSTDASAESIRAAYKARARLWHPDKNGGSEQSKQSFFLLQRAYMVLSNPTKRAIYDRFGSMGLDMAEHCDEDQQQYMAEFARNSKWAVLVMCIGLLTCCFCCYCCFGCCSMCRRSQRGEEKQRQKEFKRREKRRAAQAEANAVCNIYYSL